MSLATPWTETLDVGDYELRFQQSLSLNDKNYVFQGWEDSTPVTVVSGSVVRQISLINDLTIKANYVEVNQMVNVIFSGAVSAQATADEPVTVKVTIPGGAVETLTANTLANLSYTISKAYAVAGAYSAVASGIADAVYDAWTSSVQTFNVGLTSRTGTLIVTLG